MLSQRGVYAAGAVAARCFAISSSHGPGNRPLPALTLVRAGGLPMEGAQVVLETIVEGHKDVNPHGLAFFSAQAAASASPLDPAAPLVRKALAQLGQAIQAAGATPQNVLRVTCFVSTLADKVATRILMDSAYLHAALDRKSV